MAAGAAAAATTAAHPVNTIFSRPSGYEAMRESEAIVFQDRKKYENIEKEKAHMLSERVFLSCARKVSVYATLYSRCTKNPSVSRKQQ